MKATPSDKQNNDPKERLERKIFQQIALFGSAFLLEKLVPKEKIEDFHCFNRDNAKSFLLARLLSEVQKVGLAFERWNIFLDSLSKQDQSSAITEQTLDSLVDEQSMWQRKLVEGLVLLINFEKTNTHNHYYHFLLLHELEYYKRMLREQQDFFDQPNSITLKTIELLAERISMIDSKIGNQAEYWYVLKSKRKETLTPFRQQLKNALSVAQKCERTALCYTYGLSYSETSSNIHFDPLRLDYTNLTERFSFGVSQCGMLTIAILRRVHDLTGIQPKGVNAQLMKMASDICSDNDPTKQKLEIGDFVLADGPFLGEIVAVMKSKFGYENYQIIYLADTPIEGISDTWFPSTEIQLYMRRSELKDELLASLTGSARKLGVEPVSFSDEELEGALRKGAINLWKSGLDSYYKRVTVTRRRGYRGLGYQVDQKDSSL